MAQDTVQALWQCRNIQPWQGSSSSQKVEKTSFGDCKPREGLWQCPEHSQSHGHSPVWPPWGTELGPHSRTCLQRGQQQGQRLGLGGRGTKHTEMVVSLHGNFINT